MATDAVNMDIRKAELPDSLYLGNLWGWYIKLHNAVRMKHIISNKNKDEYDILLSLM
jgi:hypothetical protein